MQNAVTRVVAQAANTAGKRHSLPLKGLNDSMRCLLERRLTATVSSRTVLLVGVLVAVHGLLLAETPSIAARRISTPITLDGKLDEPEWRDAQVIKLVPQAPHPRAQNPYSTEVRGLVGSDAIYFCIPFHGPNPQAVALPTMVRDGGQSGDHHLV